MDYLVGGGGLPLSNYKLLGGGPGPPLGGGGGLPLSNYKLLGGGPGPPPPLYLRLWVTESNGKCILASYVSN